MKVIQVDMKRCLLVSLLLLLTSFLVGQNQLGVQARALIYNGYIYNQSSNWNKGLSNFKAAFSKDNKDMKLLYEYALAEYGMIGYCLASKSCKDIDNRIEEAIKHVKQILDQDEDNSPAQALMGGLLAMKIGQSPAKAIFIGPKSSSFIDDAVESDPNNPSAWVEMGNMRFHAPSLFGGDMKEAIECFKKAIELFERTPSRKKTSWLYLHAYAWLGKAYEELEEYDKAKSTYRRILEIEPRFQWVKQELVPQLAAKREK